VLGSFSGLEWPDDADVFEAPSPALKLEDDARMLGRFRLGRQEVLKVELGGCVRADRRPARREARPYLPIMWTSGLCGTVPAEQRWRGNLAPAGFG
jgi:hypothetical protein